MSNKKKITIGLDIGVSSVGWSILREDNVLIDYGSRLFPDAASAKDGKLENEARRSHRSMRRRIRRIKTRKNDLIKLLIKYNIISDQDELAKILEQGIVNETGNVPIVEIKYKGLKEKLSKEELLICLYHYIHKRGYFYITEEDLKENGENINRLPTEIQYDFYMKNGYYIGNEDNQKFSNLIWVKEIEKFLSKQSLDSNFVDEYISLFRRVRDYSDGPGSEKSPTPYGLWRLNKEGKVEKIGENLWDVLVGKCTIYGNDDSIRDEKTKLRGGKNSPIAEVFNFINDLTNIYLFSSSKLKLNSKTKLSILDEFNISLKTSKPIKSFSEKKLVKHIISTTEFKDINFDDVYGYRIDTSKKPLFTKLENTITIAKWLLDNNVYNELNIYDQEDLIKINNIFVILQKSMDINKRAQLVSDEYKIDLPICLELVKKIKGVMQTHSFSYKAMLEYIPVGIKYNDLETGEDTSINASTYFVDKINNLNTKLLFNGRPRKYIPKNIFEDGIISPTSKRAFIQTINVLNKIIKVYSKDYDIDNIAIELPRDKNTAEERKKISSNQKKAGEEIAEVLKFAGLNVEEYTSKLNSKTKLKLKLLKEQNYKDIYDGQEIDVIDVIKNSNKYHEEHIIPYSLCFIDSRRNKVLTKFENNKQKGNKTPFQWLSSIGKYAEFKDRVEKLFVEQKISKAKKELLLFEQDPRTEMLGFIEKNLSDTRYASKLVFDTFRDFFKVNNPNVKIKVINGALTNYDRYNLFATYKDGLLERKGIMKQREFYEHHGIDATILAFLGSNHKINQLLKLSHKFKKQDDNKIYDENTGELIEFTKDFLSDEDRKKAMELSKQIFEIPCKFSRPIYRKSNVSFSNETLISMKWIDDKYTKGVKINKLSLVNKDLDLNEYFADYETNEMKNLICYQEDKTLYNKLKNIYDKYNNFVENSNIKPVKNPFINYMISNFSSDDSKIQNFKHIIFYDHKGNKKFVKSLKVCGDEKNLSNIVLRKDQKDIMNSKKIKKSGILESLNPISARIYKDNKGKYITIPINSLVLNWTKKGLEIDNEKLCNILKSKNIFNNQFIEINAGQSIINNENKLFYFVGGGDFKVNKLEIKSQFCDNEIFFPRKQMNISIATIIDNYKLCEVDELGKIYNIRKIVL